MNLRPGMSIVVAAVTVAKPLASERPAGLHPDSAWPPPDGQRVIYAFSDRYGDSSGLAACSVCMLDQENIAAYWTRMRASDSYYNCDMVLKLVPARNNNTYHCTVSNGEFGSTCGKYGDRL